MGLLLIASPQTEPVSLDEAKQHLCIGHDDDNDLITSQLSAARRACENHCRRTFIETTWRMSMDQFPVGSGAIVLERPPLIAVSSVTYLGPDGVRQTLAGSLYVVTTGSDPALIVPAYGQAWPNCRCFVESVQVTYRAGYGSAAAAVPDDIRAAIKLLLGHLYLNRESVVTGTIATELPLTISSLLAPYVSYLRSEE